MTYAFLFLLLQDLRPSTVILIHFDVDNYFLQLSTCFNV
jgi:hypothetical protein